MVIVVKNKKEILTLKEYRHGLKKLSLGFPGGHIEKNEKPLNCIKRELLEETGILAKNWRLLLKYIRHGTYNCGYDFVYIANFQKYQRHPSKEKIKKEWMSFSKIFRMIYLNKFESAGTIASILYFFLKETIKKKNFFFN